MEINKKAEGKTLTLEITGRVDTNTSPQLENEVKTSLEGVESLIFDFTGVEYISSAGLRVLLAAYRIMQKQGEMKVTGVNESVMEVFEVTGLSDVLTVE